MYPNMQQTAWITLRHFLDWFRPEVCHSLAGFLPELCPFPVWVLSGGCHILAWFVFVWIVSLFSVNSNWIGSLFGLIWIRTAWLFSLISVWIVSLFAVNSVWIVSYFRPNFVSFQCGIHLNCQFSVWIVSLFSLTFCLHCGFFGSERCLTFFTFQFEFCLNKRDGKMKMYFFLPFLRFTLLWKSKKAVQELKIDQN